MTALIRQQSQCLAHSRQAQLPSRQKLRIPFLDSSSSSLHLSLLWSFPSTVIKQGKVNNVSQRGKLPKETNSSVKLAPHSIASALADLNIRPPDRVSPFVQLL